MKNTPKPVLGYHCPGPRMTLRFAYWLATILSVPVFLVLLTGEVVWRFLF